MGGFTSLVRRAAKKVFADAVRRRAENVSSIARRHRGSGEPLLNSQTEADSTLKAGQTPAEIVAGVHRNYYSAEGYWDDRYAWTIRTFLPSCEGKKILEVGCGNGALLELLKSTNEVVGVDASADGIAACASRGIQSYCMDPSSKSFDVVICLETMEHMMSPYYALMEMRRVLKNGGKFICSVPNPLWGHILLQRGA